MNDRFEETGPLVEIPAILRKHEDGKLHHECIECGTGLLQEGKRYVIERALRRYPGVERLDTIFEYAICLDCAEELHNSFSIESREAIIDFFMKSKTFMTRGQMIRFAIEGGRTSHLGLWFDRCAITGEEVSGMEEYQVAAFCVGDRLELSLLPYVIGGAAADQLMGRLSNKTIDDLDDFSGRHFGLPPEFGEKPRRMVPVL